MSRYQPEPLPLSSDPTLTAMLDREHSRIADGIDHRLDLEPSREVPRPQSGMVRYFEASIYDPGLGTGLYIFLNGVWNRFNMTAVPP